VPSERGLSIVTTLSGVVYARTAYTRLTHSSSAASSRPLSCNLQ